MATGSKMYTYEEVVKHSEVKDCWLVVHGKVYDVSPFLDEHPGGDDVLLSVTGKDATNDFEDIGHSDSAREMMHKYCIGEIDASAIPKAHNYSLPKQTYNPDKTADFGLKILQFLLPLLILGLAFAVRYYTKSE